MTEREWRLFLVGFVVGIFVGAFIWANTEPTDTDNSHHSSYAYWQQTNSVTSNNHAVCEPKSRDPAHGSRGSTGNPPLLQTTVGTEWAGLWIL